MPSGKTNIIYLFEIIRFVKMILQNWVKRLFSNESRQTRGKVVYDITAGIKKKEGRVIRKKLVGVFSKNWQY